MAPSEKHHKSGTLESVTKLRSIRDAHAWQLSINNYFLLNNLHSVIDGTYVEPYGDAPVGRSVRAGSVAPTLLGQGLAGLADERVALEGKKLKQWNLWQGKEVAAQAAIRHTVSTGLLVDIRDLMSAKEMYEYLVARFKLENPDHLDAIEVKLKSLRLPGHPTLDDMINHEEQFSTLWLQALDSG